MILSRIKDTISNLSGKGGTFDYLYTSLKYNVASFLGAVWSEELYAKCF